MKTLVILLMMGLSQADKLDRLYLPPAGASYAGGNPEDIQVPFEPSEAKYSFNNNGASNYPINNTERNGTISGIKSTTPIAPFSEYYSTGFPAIISYTEPNSQYFNEQSRDKNDRDENNDQEYQKLNIFPNNSYDGSVVTSSPKDRNQYKSIPGTVSIINDNVDRITKFPSETSDYFIKNPSRLPRPQAEADRQAEILNYENIITPEGFSYTFDTSNGIHADETGTAVDGVRANGSYSYIGDDGKLYNVTYSADENGFRPQGNHLPTPPPIPEAIQKVIEQAARDRLNGIVDDGSYDEKKYGYQNYDNQNARDRYRNPTINRINDLSYTGTNNGKYSTENNLQSELKMSTMRPSYVPGKESISEQSNIFATSAPQFDYQDQISQNGGNDQVDSQDFDNSKNTPNTGEYHDQYINVSKLPNGQIPVSRIRNQGVPQVIDTGSGYKSSQGNFGLGPVDVTSTQNYYNISDEERRNNDPILSGDYNSQPQLTSGEYEDNKGKASNSYDENDDTPYGKSNDQINQHQQPYNRNDVTENQNGYYYPKANQFDQIIPSEDLTGTPISSTTSKPYEYPIRLQTNSVFDSSTNKPRFPVTPGSYSTATDKFKPTEKFNNVEIIFTTNRPYQYPSNSKTETFGGFGTKKPLFSTTSSYPKIYSTVGDNFRPTEKNQYGNYNDFAIDEKIIPTPYPSNEVHSTSKYETPSGYTSSPKTYSTNGSYNRPLIYTDGPSSTERVFGEDFTGPKQQQRYDPETGYHY